MNARLVIKNINNIDTRLYKDIVAVSQDNINIVWVQYLLNPCGSLSFNALHAG